jgi:D-glycero-D-manno-heptose 1,7-bisphosphate phosphatase
MGIRGPKKLKRRAVFLDRDGVINRALVKNRRPYPPSSVAELEILPGVSKALVLLKAEGYLCFVVTNQPDVARGKISKESVQEINKSLASVLPLDDFRTCFHDDTDSCNCRKPMPGSIIELAEKYNVDLLRSYMIGDRWRDVEAGQRAGCKTIFVDYNYDEPKPSAYSCRARSLLEAARFIISES